jgi:hypothetical protein
MNEFFIVYRVVGLCILLTITHSNTLNACDVCGNGGGSASMTMWPQLKGHTIGWNYQYRSFDSEHLTLFPGEEPLTSHEQFQTTELWGRWQALPNGQLYVFVPYNFYTKTEAGIRSQFNGLGDVRLQWSHNLWRYQSAVINANLLGTLGIKMPTGKANKYIDQYASVIPGMQTGTGSWDVPIGLGAFMEWQQWSLGVEQQWRFNTQNKQGYLFGYRSQSIFRLMYRWVIGTQSQLLPQFQMGYEWAQSDRDKQGIVDYTGGHVLYAGLGFDWKYQWGFLQCQVQKPLQYELAKGQIQAGLRYQLGLNVLLNNNK